MERNAGQIVPSRTITLTLAGLAFSWQDRFFARFGTGTGHADFSTLNTHIDAIATQSVGVTPDASSQHAPWSRCAPAACRPAWRLCQQSPTPDRRNARRAQSYDITTSAVFNLNHIHPFVKTTFQSLFGFLSCCHARCIT
jgi:hypothetical protein